jgi:hypothetical protein
MTPKDKAKQLYELIRYDVSTLKGTETLINEVAKRCALIAVDEMLKQNKKITVSHLVSTYKSSQDFNENFTNVQNELDSYVLQNYGYWQEVKQEINKL